MTDNEKLSCLIDRPCTACKFHKEEGCSKWSCVFEEKSDVPERKNRMTNEEAQIVIGNIPICGDECYSIAEYQEAKAMAISALSKKEWKFYYDHGYAQAKRDLSENKGDLISRRAVNEVLYDLGLGDEENGADPEYMTALSDVRRGLDNISVYAVPERKKGKWQYVTHYGSRYRHCPFCHTEKKDDYSSGWNFCQYCGEDMRGGKE